MLLALAMLAGLQGPPAPPQDCLVTYYVSKVDYPWYTVLGFQFMGIRQGDTVEALLIPVNKLTPFDNFDPYWLPDTGWISIGFQGFPPNQYAVNIRVKPKIFGPLPVMLK